ncbi:amidohydrolase family protein [Streptomyces sp. NPDC005483]|uniref:amidohydrolase family protein n=1 Tax=Streptomyces sp. NPDC005483 TaxID=3154882 RepID=UPI0033AB3145
MQEFPFETTRAVTHLIRGGVLERHPAMRFIVPHAGGALPALADRVAAFTFASAGPPVDVLGALRRLYYDLAGFALPRLLPALLTLTDPDHLLYGSDYPYTPDWAVHALAEALAAGDCLGGKGLEAMRHRAAAALFPRLASATSAPDWRQTHRPLRHAGGTRHPAGLAGTEGARSAPPPWRAWLRNAASQLSAPQASCGH